MSVAGTVRNRTVPATEIPEGISGSACLSGQFLEAHQRDIRHAQLSLGMARAQK